MLTATNDPKQFFEKTVGDIFIVTAGNSAYWISYYMKKSNVPLSGYIDNVQREGELFNGVPIYNLNVVGRYVGGGNLRLIIPIPKFEDCVKDFTLMAEKYNINIICLIPVYKTSLKVEYNINRMLGYFRRKYLTGNIPTILANDCSGSRISEFLGFKDISPTMNSSMQYEDFIKFCQNSSKYLNEPLENMHFVRFFVDYPHNVSHDNDIAFNLDDIEIIFVHDKDTEKLKERWDFLRTHINQKRFVYLLAERWGVIPGDIVKKFSELEGSKLFLLTKPNFYGNVLKNCSTMNWHDLYRLDCPIENSFDLLGWINN